MNQTLERIVTLCSELQEAGYNISFNSSYRSYKVEHRESGNYELIIGFEFRDAENQAVLNTIQKYLSDLLDGYITKGGK